MVYIKRVMVKNFKSFGGDPVKLNFQQGFNIITGPNGSGKSNILDAVQFVLGELGSKRMRAPDLAGLIYDGAGEDHEGKAQVSTVSLYFDNTDRGLPMDRATVSIGRKLDRDGKSDYYLNGKKTSRRQVVEVLEMAGITPGGYNIVLQGTATRLSDLTPQERMTALEDLVGITEYDQKKADAKVKLSEAERKIEVAQAQIGEIRKKVNELEQQRNNALLYGLLEKEENQLTATRVSDQLNKLEQRLDELSGQIAEREAEVKRLEEERERLVSERSGAQQRLDEFSKEAAERGNTRMPMLRSDLVGKNSLRDSLNGRLRQIEQRKLVLQSTVTEKEREIEGSRGEIASRNTKLAEIQEREVTLRGELEEKQTELQALNASIHGARETAEQNQRLLEELAESLMPMQESLSGVETEINKHLMAVDSIRDRIGGLKEKEQGFLERREALMKSMADYEALKAEEAKKLEDMIQTVEDQIQRQRSIRSTIEGANQLAKEAETTITELTAKRDLWQYVVTEEKALERIREIGEAGAMAGYHGPLRSLVKIDLPLQRAVENSADGWINAVVVEDVETAKEHVERLKRTRLGMTRFIPLDQLREPQELPDLKIRGVVGPVPSLIRYDEVYAPAVYLLWGDTYVVEDDATADLVVAEGYRAVTRTGDVFEPTGGIIGGFYRRPPEWSKLVPSQESISSLSTTIKDLRGKLRSRMKELRDSGFDLRKFTQYMEDSQERVKRIEDEVKATQESVERLDYNLGALRETMEKSGGEIENEERLTQTLEERKQRTLEQIEETKERVAQLREVKLSDVASLELDRNTLNHELGLLDRRLSELQNDKNIQGGFVERILALKINEAQVDIQRAVEEQGALGGEAEDIRGRLAEIEADVGELQKMLSEVTSEVEATSKVYEQHQRTLRQYEHQVEQMGRR
ncbi:MAG TPA: AAA family ATPase, partial [Candidatus Desulfaltia sp.]|nr:AAA family ATPase [Candidatus Desulfaltia sp.]